MNKEKAKKIGHRILRIIWFTFGGLIALWTILWGIKMNSISGFGVIIVTILFAVGIYSLIIFVIITVLFLLIKWIVKKVKCKKKKSSKQGK
jgi:hypothetical protein